MMCRSVLALALLTATAACGRRESRGGEREPLHRERR